jgi:hypothetical protein
MWRDFANVSLGLWLIASPFTLGSRDPPMIWNDVASGIVIVTPGAAFSFGGLIVLFVVR